EAADKRVVALTACDRVGFCTADQQVVVVRRLQSLTHQVALPPDRAVGKKDLATQRLVARRISLTPVGKRQSVAGIANCQGKVAEEVTSHSHVCGRDSRSKLNPVGFLRNRRRDYLPCGVPDFRLTGPELEVLEPIRPRAAPENQRVAAAPEEKALRKRAAGDGVRTRRSKHVAAKHVRD